MSDYIFSNPDSISNFEKLYNIATNYRSYAFEWISGLQELYDRATGLSKTQRNALTAGIGIGFFALAGLAIGLGAYFGKQNKN